MKKGLSTYYLFKDMVAANPDIRALSPEDVAAVQRVLLTIMDDIHAVCEKYHLTYALSGGCALGAVRHKGFIPWDDDMDICMPRRDYDRFRSCFVMEYGDKYYVQEIRACPDYDLNFMKVRLKGTVFCEYLDPETDPDKCGVFIDIFPAENVYDNKILQNLQWLLSDGLQFICSCHRIHGKTDRLFKMAGDNRYAHVVIRLKALLALPFSFLSFRQWLLITEKALACCKDETSEYLSIATGGQHFKGDMYPRDWLFPPQPLEFDGHTYYGMANQEAYLTKCYGDYMQLPPVEKRERHALLKFKL